MVSGAAIVMTLVMMISAGCRADRPGRPTPESDFTRETAVFATVASLDYGAAAAAYGSLDSLFYRLRTTTTERDEAGQMLASEARTFAMSPQGGILEDMSTEGTLSTGFMTFATSGDSIPDQGQDLAELWAPVQPAFASVRNREYYRYSGAADTMLAGESCEVYLIEAVEDAPAEKIPIRRVRLVVARSDSAVIGIELSRRDDALVYEESSTVEVVLLRGDMGRFVPLKRKIDVTVRPPLRRTHRFTTTQEYVYDFADEVPG
ncbi:MAG: hypothetical protein HKN37_17870 [Rhodothermales bacterium]|nr:hypothetical protein [Rhodothermales bacterium]